MTAQCILARTLYTGRTVKKDVFLTFSGATVKSVGGESRPRRLSANTRW